MEKRAPPPVPTHRRPEMTASDEIWSGESVRKAWPERGDRAVEPVWCGQCSREKLPFLSIWTNSSKTSALNKTFVVPKVLVTKTLKSTSCKGLPVAQSNSLRIGSSRHDAQTPLPPAHRKRTCFSLRSDTGNVCCEGEEVIMAAGRKATLNTTHFMLWGFFLFTSTFPQSTSTTCTLFQYPTHSRLPFARQQRMGWTGVDPRGIEWYDCRFQPPDDHRKYISFTPTQTKHKGMRTMQDGDKWTRQVGPNRYLSCARWSLESRPPNQRWHDAGCSCRDNRLI